MIPHSLKRSHILKAIRELTNGHEIPVRRESKKYDLYLGGRRYPPKYVLFLAYRLANPGAKPLVGFRGGKRVNNFLQSRGFRIVDRSQPVNAELSGGSSVKERCFWVVSQSVTARSQKMVEKWTRTIIENKAAIMGWGPRDESTKSAPGLLRLSSRAM
jgi:hypothetical protein